ncbi:MAG: hypothetical protein KAG28_07115 [Cocleimonas sp.]|nr:hypothetical protein [Cocleimonas sp.]
MKKILIALGLCIATPIFSVPLWTDRNNTPKTDAQKKTGFSSYSARTLSLNETALRQQLLSHEGASQKNNSPVKITLPLPDGSSLQVIATEYSMLEKNLAAQFPQIKTWKVQAANGKNIHGRIDFTSEGFHAQLTLENGDTVFIDPDRTHLTQQLKTDKSSVRYHSFSKQKNKHLFKPQATSTDVVTPLSSSVPVDSQTIQRRLAQRDAPFLTTYRLALAATAEYTALHKGKEGAFNAMVTTINRVNAIYERDLSIRLRLVDKTNALIYTNTTTDPYTQDNTSLMLDENISNLDRVIGSGHYDIGHLFGGAGTAGLALLSSVCRTTKNAHKAGGVTGSASPFGDSFNIDYVSHEIGHQFGATHTFNSTTQSCDHGNRESTSAIEPGSGSTIMAYAGICGFDNLQRHSDAVFNAASIEQVNHYLHDSGKANCGAKSPSGNTNPTISTGHVYTIPNNTPFVLTSTANDAEGDQLTYTWDQQDAKGTASEVGVDTGDNPLFRSYLPRRINTRYFPSLDTLLGSAPIKGETLPTTDRELHFATTVRDQKGGIERADTKIITSGNPFALLTQNQDQSYISDQRITIRWNVSGTNSAPITCPRVGIKLLKGAGKQNLLLLLADTENDGQQDISIPSDIGTSYRSRLMVSCRNNIFFALSKGNIVINGAENAIQLAVEDISIKEGNKKQLVAFKATLNKISDKTTTVHYKTQSETAQAGEDFTYKEGVLSIAAGEKSASIYIEIKGDLIRENDETFQLLLSTNNSQIILTRKTVSATLIDDDNEAPSTKKDKAGGMFNPLFFIFLLLLSVGKHLFYTVKLLISTDKT